MDVVCLFSPIISQAKSVSAAGQMNIKRKEEGLFRFLHQSKLLSSNTTYLMFQQLEGVYFSDISQEWHVLK